DPNYLLRRVWLTRGQEEGYYYGFANSTLWPLCHQVYQRPTFDPDHWAVYRQVNELFAAAVLEEARGGPALIFVQDYHFALPPRARDEGPAVPDQRRPRPRRGLPRRRLGAAGRGREAGVQAGRPAARRGRGPGRLHEGHPRAAAGGGPAVGAAPGVGRAVPLR